MKYIRIIFIKSSLIFAIGLMTGISYLQAQPDIGDYAKVIYINGRDVQEVIDQAPSYSTIVGDDMERIIETGGTIIIDKPLRLTNFRGRLAPGTTDTRIIQINSEHVVVDNFRLYGNYGTVSIGDRVSLLRIRAGHFLIENGKVFDSMKHGIVVRSQEADTEHGIIRNIVSHNVQRDVISLTGYGDLGFFNRNILVENITAYGPSLRGAVEVSDGNEQITVRNIYADSCIYGVEIQDHRRKGQINSGIIIEGVYVTKTMSAVNFNLADYGHGNINIRDISGDNWPDPEQLPEWVRDRSPVDISNASDVIVKNLNITDNDNRPAMAIRNIDGLMLRNVFIANRGTTTQPSIQITDVSNLFIDGMIVRSDGAMTEIIAYRLSGAGDAGNVQIRGVSATQKGSAGIVLDRESQRVTLRHYIIKDNLVPISDNINGTPAIIEGNLQ